MPSPDEVMQTIETIEKKEPYKEGTRISLRRLGDKCKRNKRMQHEYIKVEEKNYGPGIWSRWTEYVCTHCGKEQLVFVNSKYKLKDMIILK